VSLNNSKKEPVLSKNAPQPIGPYSQAIRSGALLFCSGQVALDAVTGQVVGTDIETQTKKVMENLGAVLQAGGASFDHVVKTTIFLKSMDDFPKVNEIYGKSFKDVPPARSTVEVSRLPKDVLVEVEAIAVLG
jgi:2-iminobutanoate/2-iminopropanoate deaminase